MTHLPIHGEIWRHFKGGEYRILAVGKHSENQQEMVVYESVNRRQAGVWIRPLEMWFEKPTVHRTEPEEHGCLHPAQSHFIKSEPRGGPFHDGGKKWKYCQDCIDAAEHGRFLRIEKAPCTCTTKLIREGAHSYTEQDVRGCPQHGAS